MPSRDDVIKAIQDRYAYYRPRFITTFDEDREGGRFSFYIKENECRGVYYFRGPRIDILGPEEHSQEDFKLYQQPPAEAETKS